MDTTKFCTDKRQRRNISRYVSVYRVHLRDVQINDVEISGNDTIAYLTSSYRSWFSIDESPDIQEAAGTHVWILRKAADGTWQVAVVA